MELLVQNILIQSHGYRAINAELLKKSYQASLTQVSRKMQRERDC